jgi:hypothetical protein
MVFKLSEIQKLTMTVLTSKFSRKKLLVFFYGHVNSQHRIFLVQFA